MKSTKVLCAALALCLSLTACAAPAAQEAAPAAATPLPAISEAPAASAQPEAPSQPEAPQTAPDAGKKALLVVSFGTSYNETRAKTIDATEATLAAAFEGYEQRRAFTSQTIIDKLQERDGLAIDNVTQAMERLVADGVSTLVVQPTHVMNGSEYDDMMAEIAPFSGQFASITYGKPLLSGEEDFAQVMEVLYEDTRQYDDGDTAIAFMGHGTHHDANAVYAGLQGVFTAAGHANYYIGTAEGTPELADIMPLIDASGVKRVVLLPLMIVAGDHATNDMAGDEEGSWKTAFKAEGYEVECVLKGLGEYPGIQQIFVDHAKAAQ